MSARLLTPSRSTATASPNTAFSRASAPSTIAKSASCVAVPMNRMRTGPGAAAPVARAHSRSSSPFSTTRDVVAQVRPARRPATGSTPTPHRRRAPAATPRARGRSSFGVGMVARDVAQVVVQVVQQRDAMLAAVADQRIGGFDVCHGVTLRDDDVGRYSSAVVRIGEHDVEAIADRRMVERLQQPDIGTGCQRTAGEALRNHHDADPAAARAGRSAGRGGRGEGARTYCSR